jgi:hypothetical protein
VILPLWYLSADWYTFGTIPSHEASLYPEKNH